jgi:hypothetical protein
MSDPILSYLRSLVPAQLDRSEVAERRAKLSEVLDAHPLKAGYLLESGSFSHGTGIVHKSDVDYLAWASASRPQLPSTALRTLREALEGADWRIDSLRVSSPTVQVGYRSPPSIEIVPAYYSREVGDDRVFYIPGRRDEWVESSPSAHKSYVNEADRLNSHRVKGLVRLAKAWKYEASADLSSFYLEMRIAEYARREGLGEFYDLNLRWVMKFISSTNLRDINDPAGLVGRIPACSSDEKQARSLRQLRDAISSLEAAYECEKARDAGGYWSRMSDVFGGAYPWPDW